MRQQLTGLKQVVLFVELALLGSPAAGAEIFLKLGHTAQVNAVGYARDGRVLVTASADNTVKLWDVRSGELLRTLSAHEADIFALAVSPDGQRLASAGYDANVVLWEVERGKVQLTLRAHRRPVTALAFADRGNLLASGDRAGVVNVWQPQQGKVVQTLQAHQGEVVNLAFSPGSSLLATLGRDRSINLWDLARGVRVHQIRFNAALHALAFNRDGRFLLAGGNDGLVYVWNTRGGWRLQRRLAVGEGIRELVVSRDGRYLACGDASGQVTVWDLRYWTPVASRTLHTAEVLALAFSPDATRLTASAADPSVKVWYVQADRVELELAVQSREVRDVVFVPNRRVVASGHEDGRIRVWDVEDGRLVRAVQAHSRPVSALAPSPDGVWLASVGLDSTVRLWQWRSGTEVQLVGTQGAELFDVQFNARGSLLATAAGDSTVRIWDPRSGRLLHTLVGHRAAVRSLDFSVTGDRLVSGGDDYTIRVWDVTNGRLLHTLLGHRSLVRYVRFSHDGRFLVSASSDHSIKIWETQNWSELYALRGHLSPVRVAEFSPDDRRLASGGFDNSIKFWRTDNWGLTRTILAHSDDVNSLAFDTRGALLASGSPDGLVRVWAARGGDLQLNLVALPDVGWLAFRPNSLYYAGSSGAEDFAGIRLGSELENVARLGSQFKTWSLNQTPPVPSSAPAPSPEPAEPTAPARQPVDYGLLVRGLSGLLGVIVLGALVVWGIEVRKRRKPIRDLAQRFRRAGYGKAAVLSPDHVLLSSARGEMHALVCLVRDHTVAGEKNLVTTIRHYRKRHEALKVYLVHEHNAVSGETVRKLQRETGCLVLPISLAWLRNLDASNSFARRLHALEEPYLSGREPYYQLNPIADQTWFFGRTEFLRHLPALLRQRQSVGLFGLPRVGKTSLWYQVREILHTAPVATVDFNGAPAQPAEDVVQQLTRQVQARLEDDFKLNLSSPANEFRAALRALSEAWAKHPSNTPLIVVLENVDALLRRCVAETEGRTRMEYVRFLRILKGALQENRELVLLVTAVRPDLNRLQTLPGGDEANPLFQCLVEEFLGFLNPEESADLLTELGAWVELAWEESALERVFAFCGGHPLVTRLLASQVLRNTPSKKVDPALVERVAGEELTRLSGSEIGHYFQTGIWEVLDDSERALLRFIASREDGTLRTQEIGHALAKPLTFLQNLGLVASDLGRLGLTSELFRRWVQVRTQPLERAARSE